jgi:ATP-dependent Clp protease ATP-binding subunit ClpC
MDKFMVSRMVGSPPGYVGHEEGGQLTEKVRRKPYSVVLFDEVEKAHHEVMDILLQILEEGMLTDSLGRKVDFRNTVLIMTTNLGSKFAKGDSGLGFGSSGKDVDFERLKSQMLDETKRVFRPELVNRVDEMIVFRPLGREDVSKILDIELAKVFVFTEQRHINVNISRQAREFLVNKGYDAKSGARPLRRAVEKYVQDPLAEEILAGRISDGQDVNVEAGKDSLEFAVRGVSAAEAKPRRRRAVTGKV